LSKNIGVYLRPQTLDEAVRALASTPYTVLAGGTDFYPVRTGQMISEPVLDITAIAALRGIRDEGAQWRIGATTSWTDIVRADLPAQLRGLQRAAGQIGGVQVQNTGTVAGNVCNASPAADGIPALLALDARVELASSAGVRTVALTEFVLGSRKTARLANELVSAFLIPKREAARASFLKLGNRRYLVISIAMVAAVIEVDASGLVRHAAIAVGSCSAVARRLDALEHKLIGRTASAGLSDLVEPADLIALTPIDDMRGTGAYRRDAALTLVKRAIEETLHE
jgi:CO/xanthine dehydrogenase FAD-binding subunit